MSDVSRQREGREDSGRAGGYESFDLSGGTGAVHEKWPTLNLVDERTATLLGREVSRTLAEAVEVEVVGGGVRKFRDVAEELENPGCLNYLEFEALGGFGLLAVEQRLLFSLLERLFGSADAPSEGAAPELKTRFSAIEERVIRRLVVLFGRSLEEAWRPIVPLTMRHSRVETKPVNVAIARPGEWVVTTEYEVTFSGLSGRLLFAVPHSLLEGHRDRLATGQYEEQGGSRSGWERAIRRLLEGVPVDVVAELGGAQLTLGELLELKVGQVLRLDQAVSDPISVNVDRRPKYRGEIIVRHGNLAIELSAIHERAMTKQGEDS